MFNPAPRTAVITALMHPERYLGTNASPVPSNAISPAKGKHRASNKAESAQAQNMMPDTALLFKGYLESGRMVNVYDWYMAFKQGLEAQRRTLRKTDPGLVDRKRKGKDQRKRLGGKAQPETPTKPRGTGRRGRRGRGRVSRGSRFNGRPDVDPESDGHDDETGDERAQVWPDQKGETPDVDLAGALVKEEDVVDHGQANHLRWRAEKSLQRAASREAGISLSIRRTDCEDQSQ